jgi:hypothetical protein
MQKLTEISWGKNNKSCRIFHHESNKIGFTFFWFFYDFLRNLQETAKPLLLFELPFRSEALGKNFCFAMWPLGRAAGAAGAIPGELLAGLAGEGRGKGDRVARGWFGPELGAELDGGEASGGAQRRQRLRPWLRRGLGRGEGVERFGSFLRG